MNGVLMLFICHNSPPDVKLVLNLKIRPIFVEFKAKTVIYTVLQNDSFSRGGCSWQMKTLILNLQVFSYVC